MAPRLRKVRMKPGCTMESLLKLAEQTECHYQLKRVDPTDTQSTPTTQTPSKSKPVRAVEEVAEEQALATPALSQHTCCYGCGKEGHFRGDCPDRHKRKQQMERQTAEKKETGRTTDPSPRSRVKLHQAVGARRPRRTRRRREWCRREQTSSWMVAMARMTPASDRIGKDE